MSGISNRWNSLVLCATVVGLPMQAVGQSLRPRPSLVKPLHTTVDSRDESQVIYVKFHDELMVRLRDGAMTDLGTMALDQSAQATLDGVADLAWQRVHRVSEAKLDAWRMRGQNNSGRALADLNLEYYLWLPPGADAAETIDAFNALDVVEIALPVGRPVPEPAPLSFVSQQVYLNAAPDGVSAKAIWWSKCGSIGGGIEIADVENGWDFSHQDLPNDVNIVHPNSTCPPNSNTCPGHGKAVMGVIASIRNAFGTTGMAYGSTFHVVGAYEGFTNIPGAITDAMDEMLLDGVTGDVILIEMQEDGPNFGDQSCDDLIEATNPLCFGGDTPCSTAAQCGLIPVEWKLSIYNAIVTAVDNGIIVVEAAGNGWQNLDDAIYSKGNNNHWPFLPGNESGAIIVGAGYTPLSGNCVARARRHFSCYGSRIDVQG